ncbi:hypothetical protein DFH08DRAFT_1021659 [Mycena albidolilacea]|uniref:Uncharacterized protein n=1 Tax=Mycena albidolilacea TaxID=1033008 RepID=A0AAD7EJU3_9AGAR|nr:hypothetical protein DFH08DRAFT_1021659 [Mycena albidolilacea]
MFRRRPVFRRFHPVPLKAIFLKNLLLSHPTRSRLPLRFPAGRSSVDCRLAKISLAQSSRILPLKGSRMDIQALPPVPPISPWRCHGEFHFLMHVPSPERPALGDETSIQDARPPLPTLAQGSHLDIRVPTAVPPISRLCTQAEIRFFKPRPSTTHPTFSQRFRTDIRALAADFAVAQRSRFLSLRVSGSTSARWTPPHQIHPAKAEIIFQIKNKHNLQSGHYLKNARASRYPSFKPPIGSLPEEFGCYSVSELRPLHPLSHYLKNAGLPEVRPSTRQSGQSLPQECRRYRNFELRARNGISMISFSMTILHAIALVTTTLLEERGLFSRFDLRARNRASSVQKWIRGLKEGAHIDCTEEAGGIRGALKWRPEVFPSMAAEEVHAPLLRGITSVTSWGGGGTAAIAMMGIEQNRRWGVCSLNDFRKHMRPMSEKSRLNYMGRFGHVRSCQAIRFSEHLTGSENPEKGLSA